MDQYWFKQEFIQDKIKDTMNGYGLINKNSTYRWWAHLHTVENKNKCMADKAISITWLRQQLSLIVQS